MLDTVANVLGITTALIMAIGYVWRHRTNLMTWYRTVTDKLGDWYYDAYCLLFNPGKKGFNETVSVTVQVVGRIRATHNPYSGEWETSLVDFDKD